MPRVTVVVQTCPERRDKLATTIASVRASDIGDDFEVMEHPAGTPRCVFYRSVLERMAAANTPYVIRLEDDVIVGRYIVHNFLTWPALRDPRFGVGWLYASELALQATPPDRSGYHVRPHDIMSNSYAVGLSRDMAAHCVSVFDRWQKEFGCGLQRCNRDGRCPLSIKPKPKGRHGQDTLFSVAAWQAGKRVFLHNPPLAENRGLPSIVGTRYRNDRVPSGWAEEPDDIRHNRAGRLFDVNWKRGAARVTAPSIAKGMRELAPGSWVAVGRKRRRFLFR